MPQLPVLIIGAGGKTGARVDSQLTDRGIVTRAVSRSSSIPFGNSQIMHGVEEALGRPARDFADYARATEASGVWRA